MPGCVDCPGVTGGTIACKAKALKQQLEKSNIDKIQVIKAKEASE
jgi:hypothetical protein